MYNVTDNSYTRTDLPAGQAAPPHKAQVDAIHNIFQKIHQKQFNLPDNHKTNPIVVQAQLKKEALQACRAELNNHWGILKFFIFLLRLTPFKFDIEKKADQILKDTGRLYLKARELGCTDGKTKEYVEALNTAWLSRPQRPEIMDALPNDTFKDLYRDPQASLEEFLAAIDDAETSELLELKEALIDPAGSASPFTKLLNYKTKDITDLEKAAFELRNENIPDINVNENIPDQIHKLPDEELKRLVIELPEDEGHSLILAALGELSSRILNPADNSDVYLIPENLKLTDEEKTSIAKKLHNVYQKLGSKNLPLALINQLDLKKEEAIKNLRVAVEVKGTKDTHKLNDNLSKIVNQVALDKQKELEILAEKNDTKALIDALKSSKEEDKVNYLDILTTLLKNRKVNDASRVAINTLFDKMEEDQKGRAFLLFSKSDLLPQLLSANLLLKLAENKEGQVNFAYLAAFKKLIDKSPKGIENPTLAKPLLLKMTPEERRNAIEYLLKKQNPLLYISASLIDAIDKQEEIAYDKIADLVLKEPKPTVQQIKLLRTAIERMPEDDKQDFFEKMVSSSSRITFTMIKDIAAPLKEFKESFLQKKNLKSLIENNLKYADLLIATNSADKLFEIYEVEDKAELLKTLSENKEKFNLLKFLVARKFIDSDLIEEHMDDLNKEAQDFIKKDKMLSSFATKQAK